MTAARHGRLSFRTVYGGPGIPGDTITELKRLQIALRDLEWGYDYDLFVTVGGDLTVISEPTGLHRPRVRLAARTASGELRFNSDEVLRGNDPATMLRSGVIEALGMLVDRVAARDPEFDAEADRALVTRLRNAGPAVQTLSG